MFSEMNSIACEGCGAIFIATPDIQMPFECKECHRRKCYMVHTSIRRDLFVGEEGIEKCKRCANNWKSIPHPFEDEAIFPLCSILPNKYARHPRNRETSFACKAFDPIDLKEDGKIVELGIMGNEAACKEATRRSIALPCHKCGGDASVSSETLDANEYFAFSTKIECKCGHMEDSRFMMIVKSDCANPKQSESDHRSRVLSGWNTRAITVPDLIRGKKMIEAHLADEIGIEYPDLQNREEGIEDECQ